MSFRALLVAFFLFSGCATSGNPNVANQELVSQIKIGTSTKEDVRRLLGEPNFISQSSNFEIWSYAYSSVETSPATFIPIIGLFAGSATAETSSFGVSFDRNGVVNNVSRGYSKATGGPGAR